MSANDAIPLGALRALNPTAARFVDRLLCNSYSEFVDILYSDIEDCIVNMQANRAIRKSDGEDRLTQDIIDWLNAQNYNANHDQYINGHSDIVVKGRNNFMWLGEAKIHSSYPYLLQGFDQLCTRYATAVKNQDEGGLIVYIRNKNALSVMKRWRKEVAAKNFPGFKDENCPRGNQLAFVTEHTHEATGLPYKVRHMGIVLYHDPKA